MIGKSYGSYHVTGKLGTVKVRFVVAESGRVSSVKTTGLEGSVGPCIRRVFQRMRFPKSGGGPMTVNYPFKFKPQ